jgi:hypothetical protein
MTPEAVERAAEAAGYAANFNRDRLGHYTISLFERDENGVPHDRPVLVLYSLAHAHKLLTAKEVT